MSIMVNDFLMNLGWPNDGLSKLGLVKWVGEGASSDQDQDDIIEASLIRTDTNISALIHHIQRGKVESLVEIRGLVKQGVLEVTKASIGDPPTPLSVEEVIPVFKMITDNLAQKRFIDRGLSAG